MDTGSDDSIFASLPYGLCIVDDQGRILTINPALEKLLGWRLPDRRGQVLSHCLKQAMADPGQALCWTVALSQALVQGQTTHLPHPTDFRAGPDDASPVSVTGVVAPWQSSNAEWAGALVIFQDSASQRDLEGMRARFLSVLAHELSTPVTSLTIAAEQLARHLQTDDAKPRSLLQVIQNQAHRLRRLLAQFPTTLSTPTEIPQPQKRLVTLRPVLRQVAQVFQVRDLDCQIVVQTPPDLPFVWSDADRIQEILSKLVDNAIRYAPADSQVVLAAEERGDEVVVSVRDRGRGVTPEDEVTIFESWRRGSGEEPNAEHQGLSTARSLVQSLGGRLWHERRESHPSTGRTRNSHWSDTASAIARGHRVTAKILLIDDDRTTVEAIGPILTREGYQVDHTPPGRLALQQVLTDSPDLVVLGIDSKKQDGDWRFCRLLLALLESPLLLLLSTEDRLDRVKGLEVGANDCMVKPVLMAELVARVRALLRRNTPEYSRQQRSLYVDGDLVVDLTRREVRLDDEPMILTPIEFRILVCLIRQVEHVASHEHLRMQVWGPQRKGAQHSLKQHIHNLRQKLEPDPKRPRRIVTRWHEGYMLQRIGE